MKTETTVGGHVRLNDGLDRTRPLLGVRPHPAREFLHLTTELQVGWIVHGRFMSFGACKDDAAFDSMLADLRTKISVFDVQDMRSNAQVQPTQGREVKHGK